MKFPVNFTSHRINGKNLLIYPEKPAWVVLNDKEFDAFRIINKSNANIKDLEALKNVQKRCTEVNFFEENAKEVKEKTQEFEFDVYELHLILTHSCNLRCLHCYMEAGDKLNDELSFDELKAFLAKIFQFTQKKINVVLSGGEPLGVRWLSDLISFLKENDCSIEIYTNGILIKEEFLNEHSKNINNIQIGMEGISARTYEVIRKGSDFKTIKENIQLIKNHKIPLTLAIIIMPHNFEELKFEIRNFIDDIFYEDLKIRIDAEIDWEGRAENLLSLNFKNFYKNNMEEILQFTSELYRWYYQKFNLEVQSSFVSGHKMENCGIGLGMTIESNGDLFPCFWNVKNHGNVRNINDENLKKLISEFYILNNCTVVNKIKLCQQCDLKFICTGGCKVKNLAQNGNYNIPICNPELKREYYLKLYYGI